MNQPIRPTEEIARENVAGCLQDIAGYTNPANDGLLSAWMMAKSRAEDLVHDLQVVCDAIASRPSPSQQALRSIAEGSFEVNDEAMDEAMDEVEARRITAYRPDPFFSPLRVLDGDMAQGA